MLIVLSEYIVALCLLLFAYLANSDILIYAFLAVSIIFILFSHHEYSTLFMLMIVNVEEMVTLSYRYNTSVFAFLIVAYITKQTWKFKINKSVFILYFIFALYMILGLRYNQKSLLSDIQTILNYFVLLLLVADFNDSRILNYLDCFITGHFIATIFSIFMMRSNRFLMVASFDEEIVSSLVMFRFTGMHTDSNFFAYHCAFSIGCLVFILANNLTINRKKYLIQLVGNVIFGILSLSKTFILVISTLIAIILFINNKTSITKRAFITLGLLSVCALVNYFTNSMLYEYVFGRFNNLNMHYGSKINALTTGRMQIWITYLQDWISSFSKIFFGVGMAQKQIEAIHKMHHNTYIEILYQFGIIGSMMFMAYMMSLLSSIKNKVEKIDIHNKKYKLCHLSFIVILLNSFSLGVFAFNILPYMLFLSFIMLSLSKANPIITK